MRSIYKTSIIMGYSMIPVGVCSAVEGKDGFKRISPKGNETSQKVFDKVTGEEVNIGDCKSAFVLSKNEWIEIDRNAIKEEFKRDNMGIRIKKCVDLTEIPVFLASKHYYLVPDAKFKEQKQGYTGLYNVLKQNNKALISSVVMRDVLHNCYLWASPNGICMTLLEDYSLMRTPETDFEPCNPTHEGFLRDQLNLMSGSLTPDDLQDAYMDRVRKLVIDIKTKGLQETIAERELYNKSVEVVEVLTAKHIN